MGVRCAILAAILYCDDIAYYIPLLQLHNARVIRPFLFMQRGGHHQTRCDPLTDILTQIGSGTVHIL